MQRNWPSNGNLLSQPCSQTDTIGVTNFHMRGYKMGNAAGSGTFSTSRHPKADNNQPSLLSMVWPVRIPIQDQPCLHCCVPCLFQQASGVLPLPRLMPSRWSVVNLAKASPWHRHSHRLFYSLRVPPFPPGLFPCLLCLHVFMGRLLKLSPSARLGMLVISGVKGCFPAHLRTRKETRMSLSQPALLSVTRLVTLRILPLCG